MNKKNELVESGNSHGVLATQYILYLPLNHNDGTGIEPEKLQEIEQEIMRYVGGLTKFLPGDGTWIDHTAQVYQDLVMPIQMVAPPGPEVAEWFSCQVAKMATLLEQQQIFMFAQPVWLIES